MCLGTNPARESLTSIYAVRRVPHIHSRCPSSPSHLFTLSVESLTSIHVVLRVPRIHSRCLSSPSHPFTLSFESLASIHVVCRVSRFYSRCPLSPSHQSPFLWPRPHASRCLENLRPRPLDRPLHCQSASAWMVYFVVDGSLTK